MQRHAPTVRSLAPVLLGLALIAQTACGPESTPEESPPPPADIESTVRTIADELKKIDDRESASAAAARIRELAGELARGIRERIGKQAPAGNPGMQLLEKTRKMALELGAGTREALRDLAQQVERIRRDAAIEEPLAEALKTLEPHLPK